MLRAEELMVGDYLTFRDALKDNNPVTVKVVAVNGATNELLASIDGDPTLDRIDIDDELCGIPLTPEILEKNGFERGSDNLFSYGRGMYVMMWSKGHYSVGQIFGNWSAFVEFAEIRFIHELQHALQLCGIDKTIEL